MSLFKNASLFHSKFYTASNKYKIIFYRKIKYVCILYFNLKNLMNFIENLEIKDYNYILDDEKIAKYPLKKRDDSKLLVFNNQNISENIFSKLTDFLPSNGLMVFNNTKVIRARLKFTKKTGANIEIFCLEPYEPVEYELIFIRTQKCSWKCLVGNLKKWKDEILELVFEIGDINVILTAKKLETVNQNQIIEFEWNNNFTFAEILEHCGEIPIPPYLNRNPEKEDLNTYQTVYSKIEGSVAAPTAGLHFTDTVLKSISDKNIEIQEITLHVGAGTFKPVKNNRVSEHEMHTEHFVVKLETIKKIIDNLHNITAVGTTSVRTLESIYWLGVKLITCVNNFSDFFISQWEVYKLPQEFEVEKSLEVIYNYMIINNLNEINASTQIFIIPGYKFRIVDRIITNFHQPQSTLLLLVSAFIGDSWKSIYDYALKNNFRFLSYGDSSLLFKK